MMAHWGGAGVSSINDKNEIGRSIQHGESSFT